MTIPDPAGAALDLSGISSGSGSGMPRRGTVVGYRCATCGHEVQVSTVHPWRCPAAPAGDHHHVLHPVVSGPAPQLLDDPNPFVAYGPSMAWWAFAQAHGMTDAQCVELAREVADGFHVTPCGPHEQLAERLGATPGQVWVKDETGNVGGSHKARHLVGILLHLRASEELGLTGSGRDGSGSDEAGSDEAGSDGASGGHGAPARPPLAIASCGNAAIAAATLAQRAGWPLQVYVPDTVSDTVAGLLESLGAQLNRCPRVPGQLGDPAVHGFRAAVEQGAIPFSVQGPENGLCLDAARTLGWELAEALDTDPHDGPTRVLVQVGGGALAACVGWGLGTSVRLDTVQTEGGAPLQRAWSGAGEVATNELGGRWGELMTPWVDPHSLADGILDDETYDWQADVAVMRASGGEPIVAPEAAVVAAYELATELGAGVSPTGSAGLAGLLPPTPDAGVREGERVVILFTGVAR